MDYKEISERIALLTQEIRDLQEAMRKSSGLARWRNQQL
jgi:uncharacterized small protein (DUF1192 family)